MRFAVVCRCAVDVISFIIIVLLFITLWQCELHGISYKRVFFVMIGVFVILTKMDPCQHMQSLSSLFPYL